MLKHSLWLIVFSALAIAFKQYLTHGLHYLHWLHHYLIDWLSLVFAAGPVGQLIQSILALILIPLAVGVVFASLFWLIRRKGMPHTVNIIWGVWLVMLVTLLTLGG